MEAGTDIPSIMYQSYLFFFLRCIDLVGGGEAQEEQIPLDLDLAVLSV